MEINYLTSISARVFFFFLNGCLIAYQNGNQKEAGFNLRSLVRIFPKLSPKQVETLKNELGEEVIQMLKKTREAIDDKEGTEEK